MKNFILNEKFFPPIKLAGKRILYIPIVSMRSYKTGEYDLACDGNVNRMITFFNMYNYKELTITLPNKVNNLSFLEHKLKVDRFIPTNAYGVNASKTRNNRLLWQKFFERHSLRNYDVIIFEPNCIGELALPENKEIYYWCPVSETKNGVPSFIHLPEIDEYNHLQYEMIVASNNQKEFWDEKPGRKVYQHNINWSKKFFTKWSPYNGDRRDIFFPFRLTDKGYKPDEIMEVLVDLDEDFRLLYTNPNDAKFTWDIPSAELLPKKREIYYEMLARHPIVIYLEDPDEILHTSILEFIEYDCRLIYFKNNLFRHKDDKGEITDITQLESAIVEMLNDEN